LAGEELELVSLDHSVDEEGDAHRIYTGVGLSSVAATEKQLNPAPHACFEELIEAEASERALQGLSFGIMHAGFQLNGDHRLKARALARPVTA